jgi:hypothetical protein
MQYYLEFILTLDSEKLKPVVDKFCSVRACWLLRLLFSCLLCCDFWWRCAASAQSLACESEVSIPVLLSAMTSEPISSMVHVCASSSSLVLLVCSLSAGGEERVFERAEPG